MNRVWFESKLCDSSPRLWLIVRKTLIHKFPPDLLFERRTKSNLWHRHGISACLYLCFQALLTDIERKYVCIYRSQNLCSFHNIKQHFIFVSAILTIMFPILLGLFFHLTLLWFVSLPLPPSPTCYWVILSRRWWWENMTTLGQFHGNCFSSRLSVSGCCEAERRERKGKENTNTWRPVSHMKCI